MNLLLRVAPWLAKLFHRGLHIEHWLTEHEWRIMYMLDDPTELEWILVVQIVSKSSEPLYVIGVSLRLRLGDEEGEFALTAEYTAGQSPALPQHEPRRYRLQTQELAGSRWVENGIDRAVVVVQGSLPRQCWTHQGEKLLADVRRMLDDPTPRVEYG